MLSTMTRQTLSKNLSNVMCSLPTSVIENNNLLKSYLDSKTCATKTLTYGKFLSGKKHKLGTVNSLRYIHICTEMIMI